MKLTECQPAHFAATAKGVASGKWESTFKALASFVSLTACLVGVFAHPPLIAADSAGKANDQLEPAIPILVYHRFGPVVSDPMTVTTAVFESQVRFLQRDGYSVIRLRDLVDYFRGMAAPPPPRSVVITADDGHRSIASDMLPVVERYHLPVTLFIYPSAISNASYALTWEQLARLKRTGLFEIQSHTFWHPNFKIEKRRLSPEQYRKLVSFQLRKPKSILKDALDADVDMIAWPFGIYDEELIEQARQSGYIAGFTLKRGKTTRFDNIMALPRYLMTNRDRGSAFARLLEEEARPSVPRSSP